MSLHLGRKLLKVRQFAQRPRYVSRFEYYRHKNAPLVLNTTPVRSPAKGDWSVRYLTCESQLLETIWSAKSLYKHVSVPLVFHEDGSFTSRSFDLLRAHFPDATIITKKESNERTIPLLTEACQRWRERLIFFLRVFDFQVYAEGQPYLQVDSDVLFFREPSFPCSQFRYNQDPDDVGTTAWGQRYIEEKTGLHVKGFNAGLLFVSQSLSFERVEHWLRVLGEPDLLWGTEQTILNLEAETLGCAPLGPQYDVWEKNWPDVISEHYCDTSRLNMYRRGYPLLRAAIAS